MTRVFLALIILFAGTTGLTREKIDFNQLLESERVVQQQFNEVAAETHQPPQYLPETQSQPQQETALWDENIESLPLSLEN